MRTIRFILRKEFLQIVRNRQMLPIIFVMPVLQLLVLSFAVTFEIRSINFALVDMDHSMASRELASHFTAPPFYHLQGVYQSVEAATQAMDAGKVKQILVIPQGMGREIARGEQSEVQLLTDAIDGSAAALMNAYGMSIINTFNQNIIVSGTQLPALDVEYSFWFNPLLDYKTYMVPGILVLLVTMIGMFLSAMNVVREKEIGTIEQINVSPVKKYQFIVGKLLPFWIIAMFELAFGLTLAYLVFRIPIVGSVWLIFGIAAIYMLAVLGIGLFVSTLVDTQQQAMFIAWFFAVIFIIMSGLFTPVESMPEWVKAINTINPIAYFIRAMRMVMLKGSGLADLRHEVVSIAVYAISVLSLAMLRYRKTSA